MTAKEYLSQYRVLESKIKHRQRELDAFRETMALSGIKMSEKVQTSPSADNLSNSVMRLLDMETEIKEELIRLTELKHRIINEIHELDNALYIDILYLKYIEKKSLWDISLELNYEYNHIRHSHGHALQAFWNRVLKDNTLSHI